LWDDQNRNVPAGDQRNAGARPAVGQHLTAERTGDDRVDLDDARNRQGPVIPG